MTLPTVHLNGTPRSVLVNGYSNAIEKLREAENAFHNIEFNPRDYYVQGPNAWNNAADEHITHLNNIIRAIDYLENHLNHLI